MSTWFTESPIGAYIFLGAAGIVFLAAAVASRRWIYLIGIGLVVAAAAGVWTVDYLVVTDRERVEISVQKIMRSAEINDVAAFEEEISERFETSGVKKRQLVEEARKAFPGIKSVNMYNLAVEPSRDGRFILAECSVAPRGVVRAYTLDGSTYHLKLEYGKDDDGRWRLRRFEVLDAVGKNRLYP